MIPARGDTLTALTLRSAVAGVERFDHNGASLIDEVIGESTSRHLVFLHGWGQQPRQPPRHRHAVPAHAPRPSARPAGIRRGAAAARRLGHDALHRSRPAVRARQDRRADRAGGAFVRRPRQRPAGRPASAADARRRAAWACPACRSRRCRARGSAAGASARCGGSWSPRSPSSGRSGVDWHTGTFGSKRLSRRRSAAPDPRPRRQRRSHGERAVDRRVRRCSSGARTTPRRRRGWPNATSSSSAAGRRSSCCRTRITISTPGPARTCAARRFAAGWTCAADA